MKEGRVDRMRGSDAFVICSFFPPTTDTYERQEHFESSGSHSTRKFLLALHSNSEFCFLEPSLPTIRKRVRADGCNEAEEFI